MKANAVLVHSTFNEIMLTGGGARSIKNILLFISRVNYWTQKYNPAWVKMRKGF